jgi:hypothetical protein
MATAPSTDNYYIGKGNVYFTPTGGTRRHLGNAPEFELTPEIEELEHFSSMEGTRTKDLTVVLEKTLSVRVVLDEFDIENLRLALLGDATTTNTDDSKVFNIYANSSITGRLELHGANDVGPRVVVDLPSVSLIPSGTLGFISDEFGQIELTGDVLVSGGSFGTITVTDL